MEIVGTYWAVVGLRDTNCNE